jgi:hypothetical protein
MPSMNCSSGSPVVVSSPVVASSVVSPVSASTRVVESSPVSPGVEVDDRSPTVEDVTASLAEPCDVSPGPADVGDSPVACVPPPDEPSPSGVARLASARAESPQAARVSARGQTDDDVDA